MAAASTPPIALRCDHPDWPRFRAASAALGRNPGLVQGAGGNVSLKHDGLLWVKASGKWLADAANSSAETTSDIFVPVSLPEAHARALAGDDDMSPAVRGGAGLRPSIETGLHALLPQQVVLHVHSINVLCEAVRADGEARLQALLAGLPWRWVPYARPGAPLTLAIAAAADTGSHAPLALVLASHGLVVAADRLSDALALLDAVECALQAAPRGCPAPGEGAAALAAQAGGRLPRDAAAHVLALDPLALAVARLGPLYPDHVVFLGAVPVVRDAATMAAFTWREVDSPCVIVPGVGVIVRADISANAEAMLGCWAALAARVERSQPLVALAEGSILELLGWDAEKYRQSIARAA